MVMSKWVVYCVFQGLRPKVHLKTHFSQNSNFHTLENVHFVRVWKKQKLWVHYPHVDTATPRATVCRSTEVTIPPLSFSAYRNKLVIGQFNAILLNLSDCLSHNMCQPAAENWVGQWWGVSQHNLKCLVMSPLYREEETYSFTSHCSFFCPMSVRSSILQALKHETLTQCRAFVCPPSTTLSQH